MFTQILEKYFLSGCLKFLLTFALSHWNGSYQMNLLLEFKLGIGIAKDWRCSCDIENSKSS